MADPGSVSIVIPACNEAGAIGDVVTRARGRRSWREILVIDDGSTDDTRRARAAAGARVVRHPYNKGNGAAVKTGIRAATRRVRAHHRRRRPASTSRRAAAHRAPRRVRSRRRRAIERDAGGIDAALGQRGAQPAGELPHRARDPGSDVGLPRRAARVPRRVPAAAAERLLDADDDDARVPARPATTSPSSRSRPGRASARRRSASRATARSSC